MFWNKKDEPSPLGVPLGDLMHFETLRRRITQLEYDAVVNHMFALGIEDGFVQELSSADPKYIPAFDLTGVPDCFT